MPVQGEYFCLQCSESVSFGRSIDAVARQLRNPATRTRKTALSDATTNAKPEPKPKLAKAVMDTMGPSHSGGLVGHARLRRQLSGRRALPSLAVADGIRHSPKLRAPLGGRTPVPAAKIVAAEASTRPIPEALTAPVAAAAISPAVPIRLRLRWGRIIMALAVLALVTTEIGLQALYHDRVFPGVRVGDLNLGGRSLADVPAALRQAVQPANVDVVVGTTTYHLMPSELGLTAHDSQLAAQVTAAGHNQPSAIWGVLHTLVSRPIVADVSADPAKVAAVAQKLAVLNSHPAVNARPIVAGATALVLADKAGQEFTATNLNAAIVTAYTTHQKVVVSPVKLAPAIAAGSYTSDVADAQAKLNTPVALVVRKATFTPSAATIASWLVFGEPGGGARVDSGRVGAYVNAQPGSFDRAATVAALTDAVQAKRPVVYQVATRKAVATTPLPVPVEPARYSYCIATRGDGTNKAAQLSDVIKTTLQQQQGWTLGGIIAFTEVKTGCNFTVSLVSTQQMSDYSPACSGQSTCRTGNDVVINAAAWTTPPTSWIAGADAYRSELVNHEVGHWLGFDHASCASGAAAPTPLSQVTLNLGGCSPKWYAIPAEVQGLKILPGF